MGRPSTSFVLWGDLPHFPRIVGRVTGQHQFLPLVLSGPKPSTCNSLHPGPFFLPGVTGGLLPAIRCAPSVFRLASSRGVPASAGFLACGALLAHVLSLSGVLPHDRVSCCPSGITVSAGGVWGMSPGTGVFLCAGPFCAPRNTAASEGWCGSTLALHSPGSLSRFPSRTGLSPPPGVAPLALSAEYNPPA